MTNMRPALLVIVVALVVGIWFYLAMSNLTFKAEDMQECICFCPPQVVR